MTKRVLPGFTLTLGCTLFYLAVIVLIPLAALLLKSSGIGWEAFWRMATSPRSVATYRVTVSAAFLATVFNGLFGFLLAWILVRYEFPGRRLLDALVDLPFALPTAVAGISLTALFAANGWYGELLAPLGIKVAYTKLGIAVAMAFTSIPFVVRTVQPVLEDLDKEREEAAATLGASRFAVLRRVIMPTLLPALLTGFALAFARAVGEYGSVIFIAGNLPFKTEIVPLLIIIRLEEFDYAGATAIAAAMLILAFAALLVINLVQVWARRRYGAA